MQHRIYEYFHIIRSLFPVIFLRLTDNWRPSCKRILTAMLIELHLTHSYMNGWKPPLFTSLLNQDIFVLSKWVCFDTKCVRCDTPSV